MCSIHIYLQANANYICKHTQINYRKKEVMISIESLHTCSHDWPAVPVSLLVLKSKSQQSNVLCKSAFCCGEEIFQLPWNSFFCCAEVSARQAQASANWTKKSMNKITMYWKTLRKTSKTLWAPYIVQLRRHHSQPMGKKAIIIIIN